MGGPSYLDPGPEPAAGDTRATGHGRDPAAEPSYYEIALTSRQVLVGFVILLASVVVAFFAGVWVGKSGAPPPREEIARVEPREARPGAKESGRQARGSPGKADPEEFQFFSEEPDKARGAAPAAPETPPAATGSTLAEDVGGAPSVAPATQTPAPASAPTDPSPPPAPVPSAPATVPATVVPAAAPPAAPAVAPAAAPTATPATAPAAGSLIVQVFSSTDEAQARKVLDQLTKAGFKAFISPTAKDGATMHRVRVGPFRSDADAKKVADAIKKKFKLETWITR